MSLTNEQITEELINLRKIRNRLKKEYEYAKVKYRISKSDEAKEEAMSFGKLLGYGTEYIEEELKQILLADKDSEKHLSCRNPKNKDAVEYINTLRNEVLSEDKEVTAFTVSVVFNDGDAVATGSIGNIVKVSGAIAVLMNDIENHAKDDDVEILPIVKQMYRQIKKERKINGGDD